MTVIHGFILAQGALLVLLSAGVVFYYGKRFVAGADLLPLHVTLIALSYLLLSVVAGLDFIDQVDEPLSAANVLTELGYAIGLVSLFIILTYERQRARS